MVVCGNPTKGSIDQQLALLLFMKKIQHLFSKAFEPKKNSGKKWEWIGGSVYLEQPGGM
jgi:hypothetical protein